MKLPKLLWDEPDFLLLAAGVAVLYLVARPVVSYAADVVVGAPTAAGSTIEAAGARVFRKRGYEAIVTSARDGQHMEGSAHYTGEARDFRTWHVRTNEEKLAIARELAAELGPAYDVVMEWDPEHLHAEADPRRSALGALRRRW